MAEATFKDIPELFEVFLSIRDYYSETQPFHTG